MKLYGHPMSQHSRRIQILCAEIGLPCVIQHVALDKGEQYSERFLKLNPNGKVPVLEDDGLVLWESHAIMRYIARKHGATQWYPVSCNDCAVVDMWLDWNHTRLNPEVSAVVLNTIVFGDKGDKNVVENATAQLQKILPIAEDVLASHRNFCGPQPTIADLSIASTVSHLVLCGHNLQQYQALSLWYERMASRPSFTSTRFQR